MVSDCEPPGEGPLLHPAGCPAPCTRIKSKTEAALNATMHPFAGTPA